MSMRRGLGLIEGRLFPSPTSGRAGWGSFLLHIGRAALPPPDRAFARPPSPKSGRDSWLRPGVELALRAAAVLLLDGVGVDGAQEMRHAHVDRAGGAVGGNAGCDQGGIELVG